VKSNKLVKADEGRVSLQRGPVIYCAEAIDQKTQAVMNLVIDDTAKLNYEYQSALLNGVGILTGTIKACTKEPGSGKVSIVSQDFKAIPYYAWANRGAGEMTVWFPEILNPLFPDN
jgi:DUF1680 family protein